VLGFNLIIQIASIYETYLKQDQVFIISEYVITLHQLSQNKFDSAVYHRFDYLLVVTIQLLKIIET
jgi:hypothetical protein